MEKELIPQYFCSNVSFYRNGFKLKSDPELESQINDRISFKSFLKLPMDFPSPDHSTFSRFRKRLSKEAMNQINSELVTLPKNSTIEK